MRVLIKRGKVREVYHATSREEAATAFNALRRAAAEGGWRLGIRLLPERKGFMADTKEGDLIIMMEEVK